MVLFFFCIVFTVSYLIMSGLICVSYLNFIRINSCSFKYLFVLNIIFFVYLVFMVSYIFTYRFFLFIYFTLLFLFCLFLIELEHEPKVGAQFGPISLALAHNGSLVA